MSIITPVILSGGVGSRLWPLSRAARPKQLQPLVSEATMLQETARRVSGAAGFAAPIVVCGVEHRFAVAQQLQEDGVAPQAIALEPEGRNTAPAAAVAALIAQRGAADALILILPADHYIADPQGFRDAARRGARAAAEGALVAFGVKPDRAETGYGYIERADALSADGELYEIARFVEKPDAATAEAYLATDRFYWNGGMFLFRADRYLEELAAANAEIVSACRDAIDGAEEDLDFLRLDEAAFTACPSDSIDYAVMERTRRGVVAPIDIGWSDIGSWSALAALGSADDAGNVAMGDVMLIDAQNNYVRATDRLVAAVGVEDLVVVSTADATLVAHKDRAQNVKALVDRLKADGRSEHEEHVRVYRPWGYYQTIHLGERHQVKHLMVRPGGRLSLQMHHHRAEHWVVVSGTARVTRDDEEIILTENQSIYLPLGCRHRLENPGKLPLSIIEVQSGSYLGEDDIVRFEDVYNRA